MVGHDNAVDAHLDGLFRIGHALDPFNGKRLAARDAAPLLHEPRQPVPGKRVPVPDVPIDPLGPDFERLLVGIQALFLESCAERRVPESQVAGAVLVVKGIVAHGHVVMSPRELPRVGREQQGRVPVVVRPLQHGQRDGVVGAPVQLVEADALVAVGLGYVFNAVAPRRRERVGQVQLPRDLGRRQLARRVVDAVDADRGKAHGRRDPVPENGRGRVAVLRVDQHARDDLVAVKGQPVGVVSPGQAGVARRV